jgi:hypothetical protein
MFYAPYIKVSKIPEAKTLRELQEVDKFMKKNNMFTWETTIDSYKEELNKWRHGSCSFTGRPNIVKMLGLPNLMFRFNVIPVKIQANDFYRYSQACKRLKTHNTEGNKKLEHCHFLTLRHICYLD